eukprot:15436547-Alexandrium_andersonii.AAC.1
MHRTLIGQRRQEARGSHSLMDGVCVHSGTLAQGLLPLPASLPPALCPGGLPGVAPLAPGLATAVTPPSPGGAALTASPPLLPLLTAAPTAPVGAPLVLVGLLRKAAQ